ncbi:DUF202 domain-containing protein [bacterium]|nr:DUF202 domain-containing protein [bacterium]
MIKYIFNNTPIFKNKECIILRDYLALERTQLANERTLLSYIRASLYLVLGGIAFMQLKGFANIRWLGYLSLLTSVVLMAVGIIRFTTLNRRLNKIYTEDSIDKDHKE